MSESRWTPERIKSLRQSLKMSQTVFAAELGTNQQTVSDWETGKHSPAKMSRKVLDQWDTVRAMKEAYSDLEKETLDRVSRL